MEKLTLKIIGTTPLLMHRDSVEHADAMGELLKSTKKGQSGPAGDDRWPSYRWVGYCYHDERDRLCIPAQNLFSCLLKGAVDFKPAGATKKQSIKPFVSCEIAVGDAILTKPALTIEQIEHAIEPYVGDFKSTKEAVERDLGFALDVRRAKVGSAKHVRVRPMFYDWEASCDVVLACDKISKAQALELFAHCGMFVGVGDWRPGAPTPGLYGKFRVEIVK